MTETLTTGWMIPSRWVSLCEFVHSD